MTPIILSVYIIKNKKGSAYTANPFSKFINKELLIYIT